MCVCIHIHIHTYGIHIHTMEYYSAIKRMKCIYSNMVDLEITILSEGSWREKDKYPVWLTCGIFKKKKKGTYELMYKTNPTDKENNLTIYQRGKTGRGIN